MFVKIILYILIHTLRMKKSNKKSNKIAFFVIHDAILSLTLKGKILSIKIMEVNVQSILFQHPCNIFITGPSGCGKTEFVHKLIDYRKDLFNIVPERVVWCYKEWQQSYSHMQEKFNSQFELIKFVEGIPMDENEIVSDVTVPHLIVVDDMLGEKDEEKMKFWFTRKGHHRNASVIYITQNVSTIKIKSNHQP